MNMANLNRYLSGIKVMETMFIRSIIDEEDFVKAETHLAKKHCIKPNSIFKLNDLINEAERVIYGNTKKE